jgi:hypothetical protein
MHKDIIPISDSFWNVRGSYKIRGLIDVGTQASLVRRKKRQVRISRLVTR